MRLIFYLMFFWEMEVKTFIEFFKYRILKIVFIDYFIPIPSYMFIGFNLQRTLFISDATV